jgi:hypothetical protein
LKELLNSLDSKQQILIIGDVNIDINEEKNANVIGYKNIMASNGLRRCIYSDTRVEIRADTMSNTCIDHIYTRVKNIDNAIHSVVFETKISDNFIIMIGIHQLKSVVKCAKSAVKIE